MVTPNAGPQAPPIAEARYERRLLAVACRPMLGQARGSCCSSSFAPSLGCEATDVVGHELSPVPLSPASPLLQLKRIEVFGQGCACNRM